MHVILSYLSENVRIEEQERINRDNEERYFKNKISKEIFTKILKKTLKFLVK
jgi:hypothetical protein